MPSPVAVAGLTGVTQLALGGSHACALLADHTVACWGTDLVMSAPVPTVVAGLGDVVAVAAGSVHTCALIADGTVSCWGDNLFGQLGTSARSLDPVAAPAAVSGLSGVTAIAARGDDTCALLGDGTVRCWGTDDHGQIGDGSIVEFRAVPTAVHGISGATAITVGNLFSCALLGNGTIRCWGEDQFAELGDQSTARKAVATPVGVQAPVPGNG